MWATPQQKLAVEASLGRGVNILQHVQCHPELVTPQWRFTAKRHNAEYERRSACPRWDQSHTFITWNVRGLKSESHNVSIMPTQDKPMLAVLTETKTLPTQHSAKWLQQALPG